MRDTNINMADTLQKSNMQNPKTLREKLTAWDAKLNPTAQLTEKQRDSFMELTTQSSNRPIAPEVLSETRPSSDSSLSTLSLSLSQAQHWLSPTVPVSQTQWLRLWLLSLNEMVSLTHSLTSHSDGYKQTSVSYTQSQSHYQSQAVNHWQWLLLDITVV